MYHFDCLICFFFGNNLDFSKINRTVKTKKNTLFLGNARAFLIFFKNGIYFSYNSSGQRVFTAAFAASDQLAMWRFLHPFFDGRPWPCVDYATACSALSINCSDPFDYF